MKLLKGQKVYYFRETGSYMGEIMSGNILEAKKDMYTGKIFYTIEQYSGERLLSFAYRTTITLSDEHLYTSLKKIVKDYKEYLIYGAMLAKVQKIEKLLNEVVEHYSEKITDEGSITLASGNICTSTRKGNLIVDGIGDIAEEINKLKTDIDKVKKKIKTPRKKPVKKESNAILKGEDVLLSDKYDKAKL